MYNRRILISEDEKARILNLHENRKVKEWGFIFEQGTTGTTTTGTTTGGGTCASAPGLKKLEDEVAFRAFAKKNYGEEVVQFGKINIPGFVDKPSVFCNPKFKALGIVYNHKPASGGGKSIGELYLAGGGASGGGSSTASYTVDMGGGKTQVMDSAALKTAIESGQIKGTTKIWKKGLPSWIEASTAEDLKDFFSGVAPELKGPDKLYKISPDGKAATMKEYTTDQVIAAIKDKTLSDKSYVVNAAGTGFESIMNNPELAKIVQTTMGPSDVQPQRKPTGIPELDTWLKGSIGAAWDQIKDPKQKEDMYDSFEKTDPIISKLKDSVGKNKVRAALGMRADTMLGRAIQGGREKLGKAISGTQPQQTA